MRERFAEALALLNDGGTRWKVIGSTIAFPLAMLLGGALTALGDSILLCVLAAVPALLVVGMVGAFGRFVLGLTLQGLAEAENPPTPGQLVREAPGVLLRLAAPGAMYLGPGLLLAHLGQWPSAVLLLCGGLVFLPMATALLLGTGDWNSVSPRRVLAALRRAHPAAIADAGLAAALLLPAALAALLTLGQPAHTALGVIGPLAAAPALLAARLLGLTLGEQRQALAGLFRLPAVEELYPANTPADARPDGPRTRPAPRTRARTVTAALPLPAASPAAKG